MNEKLKIIHRDLTNGNRKAMVKKIDEYGTYDFFEDYYKFLEERYVSGAHIEYFRDATVSYFKIKGR